MCTDTIGGRVNTDLLSGFLLDRGFQVLLTSYPELKRLHILGSLNLKAFLSGAICRRDHSTYRLISPFRHFAQFLTNIHNLPLVTCLDFLKLERIIYSKAFLSCSADKLLKEIGSKSVCCFYFSAEQVQTKKLPFLNFGNDGPITNLCIPNHIHPSYAPNFS